MTNLEIKTMDAVKSASRDITKHIESLHNTDMIWEQRRYEIAKDILANLYPTECYGGDEDAQVRASVRMADKLIKELLKPTE